MIVSASHMPIENRSWFFEVFFEQHGGQVRVFALSHIVWCMHIKCALFCCSDRVNLHSFASKIGKGWASIHLHVY